LVIYRSLKYQVFKSKTEVKSSDLKRMNVTSGLKKLLKKKRKTGSRWERGRKMRWLKTGRTLHT
jgi:dTDP-glucose pyrophosphorylase